MVTREERVKILKLIERGDLTPEQGAGLLQALDSPEESGGSNPVQPLPPGADGARAWESGPAENVPADQVHVVDAVPDPKEFRHWAGWWKVPLWVGVGISVVGAILMYLAVQGGGINFWFFLAFLLFLLGVAIMALAWSSRKARWLHIRVREGGPNQPKNINLSFPLPLGVARWGLSMAGKYSPQVREKHLEDALSLIQETTHTDPIYIKVDEDDGDQVEIYIG